MPLPGRHRSVGRCPGLSLEVGRRLRRPTRPLARSMAPAPLAVDTTPAFSQMTMQREFRTDDGDGGHPSALGDGDRRTRIRRFDRLGEPSSIAPVSRKRHRVVAQLTVAVGSMSLTQRFLDHQVTDTAGGSNDWHVHSRLGHCRVLVARGSVRCSRGHVGASSPNR